MPIVALSSEDKESLAATASAAPSLSDMQAAFQRAVMSGDDAILAEILDSSRTDRQTLFGVYRHAYAARLVEVVRNDHPLLNRYLGSEAFSDLATKYIAAFPSRTPNARWVSHRFPNFLADERAGEPHLAELAELERTLNDAFDAPDAEPLQLADLAAIPPDDWPGLVFVPHPSARRLAFMTNAHALWLALKDDKAPPQVENLPAAQSLLVWRHQTTPKVRRMADEEAMMWNEAVNRVPFGGLCELIAIYDDPETAPLRAAQHLQGWITSGALANSSAKTQPED